MKKVLAYEFQDKKKLMYFINMLAWKYNIDTSVLIADPAFEKTSEQTPSYIITEEDGDQYTITNSIDSIKGDVQVINNETL